MKPLIPYVGTNDYVKESFGFIGVKTNKPNKLKSLFAEASSVQKCNILNAIYENYEAHNLSENQSLHLISLVERADDLCDIAIEYIEFCESVGEDFDVEPVNITVFGENVMTIPEITDSFHRNSIIANQAHKDYSYLENTEDNSAVKYACIRAFENVRSDYESYLNGDASSFDVYSENYHFDDVPSIGYLMVESIHSEMCKGVVTPEDASVEKGFILKSFNEFDIGAMLPEANLTGDDGDAVAKSTSVLDMIKADDAEIDSEQGVSGKEAQIDLTVENSNEYAHALLAINGFFTALEAVVPKNNVDFDTEVRKLYGKIKDCVDRKEDDENEYLKKCLNVNKTRYAFRFKQDSPMKEDQIRSLLLMLKFIPNKVNNQIVDYTKKVGNLDVKLQFDGMDSGIQISYVAPKAEPVQEAVDRYVENRTRVANMINSVLEAVAPYAEDEFGRVEQFNVVDYLESEIMNTTSPIAEASKVLLEYCTSDELDQYEMIERARNIYEFVMNDRYACYVVLNDAEMMEDVFNESDAEIDEDIKPIIELLNRLGYNTKYSCSGHNKTRIEDDNKGDGVYQGKLYSTARITFDKKYNFKIIPSGWYQNPNADKTSIYVEPLKYNPKDGSPDEAFKKWKDGYMNSLKAWVEDLEEAKKTNSTAMAESVLFDLESFGQSIIGR